MMLLIERSASKGSHLSPAFVFLAMMLMMASAVRGGGAEGSSSKERDQAGADGSTPIHGRSDVAGEDEAAVRSLIRRMGDDDYQTRERAHKQLQEYGAGAVPVLLQFRDHEDTEIATRVRQIIEKYDWMTTGVIVVELESNGQAARKGLRVGDVLVRVDKTDVTGLDAIRKLSVERRRTLHVWRAGRILAVTFDPGAWGFEASGWALKKGGNDHARGIAAVVDPGRWAEAYRRLRAAADHGADDDYTMGLLAGLAEYAHDHQRAMKYHEGINPGARLCYLSHNYNIDANYFHNLPFRSALTAELLARERREQFSAELQHQLEDYFSQAGRNYPLASRLVTRKWPENVDLRRDHRHQSTKARMRIALWERRYGDALALAEADRPFWSLTCSYAMYAAILKGDDARVQEFARRQVQLLVHHGGCGHCAAISNAVAYFAAKGDEPQLTRLLNTIGALKDTQLNDMFQCNQYERSCLNRSAAAAMVRLLEERINSNWSPRARSYYLRWLSAIPGTTAEQFDREYKRLVHNETDRWEFAEHRVFALMRFGQYDKASTILDACKLSKYSRSLITPTLECMNQPGLTAETRKQLDGVVQAAEAKKLGGWWVRTYDNRVLHLDKQGQVHAYPGLGPMPLMLLPFARHLELTPQGMTFRDNGGTFDTLYLFDASKKRWRDSHDIDQAVDVRDKLHAAMYLSDCHMRRHYPGTGLPRTQVAFKTLARNWVGVYYEGDVLCMVRRVPLQLIDINKAISSQLEGGPPLRVYWPGASQPFRQPYEVPDEKEQITLHIPTNRGLWHFDQQSGKVSRITLGLPREDVMVSILSWPRRAGKKYIGVAPQQGGQIVELDVKTHATRLTSGYCGLGPEDAYSWWIRITPLRVFMKIAMIERERLTTQDNHEPR